MLQRTSVSGNSSISSIYKSDLEAQTYIDSLRPPEDEVVTNVSLHNEVLKIVCKSGKEYASYYSKGSHSHWLEVPQEVEVSNSVFYRNSKLKVNTTKVKGN